MGKGGKGAIINALYRILEMGEGKSREVGAGLERS